MARVNLSVVSARGGRDGVETEVLEGIRIHNSVSAIHGLNVNAIDLDLPHRDLHGGVNFNCVDVDAV